MELEHVTSRFSGGKLKVRNPTLCLHIAFLCLSSKNLFLSFSFFFDELKNQKPEMVIRSLLLKLCQILYPKCMRIGLYFGALKTWTSLRGY